MIKLNEKFTLRFDYEYHDVTYPLLIDTGEILYPNPHPNFGLMLNWEDAPRETIASFVWRIDHNKSAALWKLAQTGSSLFPAYSLWRQIDRAIVEVAMSGITAPGGIGHHMRRAREVATIGGWHNGKWHSELLRRVGEVQFLKKTSYFYPRRVPFFGLDADRQPSKWRPEGGQLNGADFPLDTSEQFMVNDADGATLSLESSGHSAKGQVGLGGEIKLTYRREDKAHTFSFRLPDLTIATYSEPGKIVPPSIDLSKLTYRDRIKLSTSHQERMRVNKLSKPHWEAGKSKQCYYVNRFFPFGAHWEVMDYGGTENTAYSEALLDCCMNALPLWPRWATETNKLMAKRLEAAKDPRVHPYYPIGDHQRELCLTPESLSIDQDAYYGHVILSGMNVNSFATGVQMVALNLAALGTRAKFGWTQFFG
ncbi:hypothetical protein [Dongia rigui]|uniref:hypothetical protein n=1 Tax=Dongia rigui TaxID=940149 RepID=UPI002A69CBF9|nr:hypothetical protein [Dongia rigui]